MTSKPREPRVSEGPIREFSQTDLSESKGSIVKSNRDFEPEAPFQDENIPENVVDRILERNKREALIDRIQEEYSGEGLVLVNEQTSEVITIAETHHNLAQQTNELDYDDSEALLVRCDE